MFNVLLLWFGALVRLFRSQRDLVIENLLLRQQLAVFKRRRPRPSLAAVDKLFWLIVRRYWNKWKQSLILVTPETVVRWHRAGFRWYWRQIARVRKPIGRKPTPKDLRRLIFRVVAENPTWGDRGSSMVSC